MFLSRADQKLSVGKESQSKMAEIKIIAPGEMLR